MKADEMVLLGVCAIGAYLALSRPPDTVRKTWKMAFVIVQHNGVQATQEEIDLVQTVKQNAVSQFSRLTRGLGRLDLSYPLTIMDSDDTSTGIVTRFYINGAPIGFDQIAFFYTNEAQPHAYATNSGGGPDPNLRHIVMFNTSGIYAPDANARILMHEMFHYWGGGWSYLDTDGTVKKDNQWNLGVNSGDHLSPYIDCGDYEPLAPPYFEGFRFGGGYNWTDNGDGTFTATAGDGSDYNLNLYLMGLIPQEEVNPVRLIVPTFRPSADGRIVPGTHETCTLDYPFLCDTVQGTLKTITIDQIIASINP